MRLRSLFAFPLIVLLLAASALAQSSAVLTMAALDGSKTTYTLEQLRQMPQKSASITNPHTKSTETYEGVPLAELLRKANAPLGEMLRGDEMRDYVEIEGSDGYKAVFALAELDPAFQDNQVLVAVTSKGKPLDEKVGPIRVVAPEDKRPARSVRMVTMITVRRAP